MTHSSDLRLDLIVTKKAEQVHPRYRSCLSADCDHGQIHHERDNPCVHCVACGAMSCFTHGIPWHHGFSCALYDARYPGAVSLLRSEEVVKSVAKKCPEAGCVFYVEKDGGCDNMYCSRCLQIWDWADVKFDDE